MSKKKSVWNRPELKKLDVAKTLSGIPLNLGEGVFIPSDGSDPIDIGS